MGIRSFGPTWQDFIEVKILRVETEERKIGLSRKRVEWAEEDEAVARQKKDVPKEKETRTDLKGGLGASGPLIAPMPSPEETTASEVAEGSPAAEEPEAEADTKPENE